jgi:putative flippase GtrA
METLGQFIRFGVVGVISNGALYLLYLGMTYLGMGHKLAATIAYAIGVLQTFVFNRSWSFRDRGAAGPALVRYVTIYGLGYILNMAVLVVAVDRAGYPHQWVQGIMILVLAVFLFTLQKLWVFRKAAGRA